MKRIYAPATAPNIMSNQGEDVATLLREIRDALRENNEASRQMRSNETTPMSYV